MFTRALAPNRVLLPLLLAAVFAVAVPATASAVVIGEDPYSAASTMTVPFADTQPLVHILPTSVDVNSYFQYWYSIPMTAGQTIEVTTTAAPLLDVFLRIWSTDTDNPNMVTSELLYPGTDRLRFMAPFTGNYSLGVDGASAGEFTLSAAEIAPVRFTFSSMVAPKRVKRRASCTVSTKLTPGYNSITTPVRFYVQRRSSGRWRSFTSKLSVPSAGTASYTKWKATFKFSKRGTYRIRARFADAAHVAPKYNKYKTVYVR